MSEIKWSIHEAVAIHFGSIFLDGSGKQIDGTVEMCLFEKKSFRRSTSEMKRAIQPQSARDFAGEFQRLCIVGLNGAI
jgi:hypothetical protein